MFINDDASADAGSLVNNPTLDLTVDPPPQTTIGHPPKETRSRRATFKFTSNEPGATFQCKLDGGLWRACTSPGSSRTSSFGRHTFQVRAIDSSGTNDPTPATWVWRVRRS